MSGLYVGNGFLNSIGSGESDLAVFFCLFTARDLVPELPQTLRLVAQSKR